LNQYLDIEYLLSSAGIRSDNDNNDEMLSVHDKKDMKLPIAGLYSDVLNTAIGPKSLKVLQYLCMPVIDTIIVTV
jgi:hypothetical protein